MLYITPPGLILYVKVWNITDGPVMRTLEFCCCCCSFTKSCPSPCEPMNCSMPGFLVLYSLSEFAQVHVHWVSDAIQPSHPLSSPSPLALNLYQHRVFPNESGLCIRWPKYWRFSFSTNPFNENLGLVSFRTECFALLTVQGTLKSLLQHHSSKASILCFAAFFIAQLSHP